MYMQGSELQWCKSLNVGFAKKFLQIVLYMTIVQNYEAVLLCLFSRIDPELSPIPRVTRLPDFVWTSQVSNIRVRFEKCSDLKIGTSLSLLSHYDEGVWVWPR